MSEEIAMPNKTIYVTDADLPIFERAQELAGGNLSAAIAQALRQFVEVEQGQDVAQTETDEITVKVGRHDAYTQKRFHGKQIAKQTLITPNEKRQISYRIYQTVKDNFAVAIKDTPNWSRWTTRKGRHWGDEWEGGEWWQQEARLEVYESLDALRDNVPGELYEIVVRVVNGGSAIEDLDI